MDITPENLEKAGFIKAVPQNTFFKDVYCFSADESPGDRINVVFWESGHVDVLANIRAVPLATTMQDIAELKRLFLGIKPEPQPITAEGLEALGFEKTERSSVLVLDAPRGYVIAMCENWGLESLEIHRENERSIILSKSDVCNLTEEKLKTLLDLFVL